MSSYHKTFLDIHIINPEGIPAAILSLQDLPSFACFLPFIVRSTTCVSIIAKMKVYYTVGTIAHNGPLFWLDVVERSLVKHISAAIMSHPVISIPLYLLPPSSLALLRTLFVHPKRKPESCWKEADQTHPVSPSTSFSHQ